MALGEAVPCSWAQFLVRGATGTWEQGAADIPGSMCSEGSTTVSTVVLLFFSLVNGYDAEESVPYKSSSSMGLKWQRHNDNI